MVLGPRESLGTKGADCNMPSRSSDVEKSIEMVTLSFFGQGGHRVDLIGHDLDPAHAAGIYGFWS